MYTYIFKVSQKKVTYLFLSFNSTINKTFNYLNYKIKSLKPITSPKIINHKSIVKYYTFTETIQDYQCYKTYNILSKSLKIYNRNRDHKS